MGLGLNDAKVTSRGAFFAEGIYLVQVKNCKEITTRPPKRDRFFVASFEVLESSNPAIEEGSTRDWMVNLAMDSSPSDIKAFLVGCAGLSLDDTQGIQTVDWDGYYESALETGQPPRGAVLRLECRMKETKRGGQFTMHQFSLPSMKKAPTPDPALARALEDGWSKTLDPQYLVKGNRAPMSLADVIDLYA